MRTITPSNMDSDFAASGKPAALNLQASDARELAGMFNVDLQ